MNMPAQVEALTQKSTPKPKKEAPPLTAYRVMVFYRFMLAAVGGYALAALSAMWIAQTFADSRSSAAMSATIIAFLLHACAFIWVFMVQKTLKASLGILLPCLVLWILIQWMGA